MPSFQGTITQFLSAPIDQIYPMPSNLSFEQAAALPSSGLTALQSLQSRGLKSGHRLSIIGASGGTGHVALRVTKALGARVTSACRRRNASFVRRLGSDDVCEYDDGERRVLQTLMSVVEGGRGGKPFDMVLDCVSSADESDARFGYERIIREQPGLLDGMYLLLGGKTVDWIKAGVERVCGLDCFSKGRRLCWVRFPNSTEDLKALKRMAEDGKLTPHISKVVNFDAYEVHEAFKLLMQRRVVGKIVVKIDE